MSSSGNDEQLMRAVVDGDFGGAIDAIHAGASVNGPPDADCPPFVAAILFNHVAIIVYMIGCGADPEKPLARGWACTRSYVHAAAPGGRVLPLARRPFASPWAFSPAEIVPAAPGSRALHIAARNGSISIVGELLGNTDVDPNSTDKAGSTPLMASMTYPDVPRGVVWLLLKAGADPTLADEKGAIPLHMASLYGNVDLFDMLLSSAPETLDRCAADGTTPLLAACSQGHDKMISKLLSLGAMQPIPSDNTNACHLPGEGDKGFRVCLGWQVQTDRAKECCISRMLQRGPAYRARSWAWACNAEADDCESGEGGTATGGGDAVLSTPQPVKATPTVGVLVARPKDNSRGKFFVRTLDR